MREQDRTRFESKFEVADGCWLWTSTTKDGYGIFGAEQRALSAHRVSYEYFVGPIPNGLVIDHLCRVPLCVNPDHLEAVSSKTNILRGTGIAARNARKTHCKHGHEFTSENTYIYNGKKGVARLCRSCLRENARRARKRAKK